MRVITDLHIHSRFSRACSKQIDINNLEKYARIKGIGLLGTGDFQHPLWFAKDLNLLEEREGILYTKTGFPFLWQTEISLMYSQGGKGRRIHHVIFAPNKDVVKQIIEFLKKKGRIDYDGRPIFGFSSIELVDAMNSISDDIEIIPAHCMTPFFGCFGSKSGFDSLKEAFGDKVNKIHAVESGISADPEMLWKFSFLNNKAIVSFSDSHSFWPWRMGRESTIFKLDPEKINYKKIIKQIRDNSFEATVETEPAYGKYHWDGHRGCNFSCSPKETKKLNGICPKCGKPLTIGVENRVEELTDQDPKKSLIRKSYYKLIPLSEILSTVLEKGIATRAIWLEYNKLINEFKNEFNILLNVDFDDLKKITREKIAKLIIKNREGKLRVDPGYDGVYGKLILKNNLEMKSQKTLNSY